MSSSQSRAAEPSMLVVSALNIRRFAIVAIVGAVGGIVIPSLGGAKQPILLLAFLGLSARLVWAIVRRQFAFAWGITAFLCATEPAFRAHTPALPYLSFEYLLLGCGVLYYFLSRPAKSVSLQPVLAYGCYVALELIGSTMTTHFADARGLLVPSMLMFVYVLNGRRVRLTPAATTYVLASYVAGSLTVAGFALRSYLSGKITWGTESNFEASGGMPPNHISLLLSLAVFICILFAEDSKRVLRVAFMAAGSVLGVFMVLTFSRGGTFILGGALFLNYVVLRRRSGRTAFLLVAVTMMALLVSYSTREITEGKVSDRYAEATTSNRYTIVVSGFGIYADHPFVGVGTGNFHRAMVTTDFAQGTGAHNELVRSAAEHGTIGLIVWLWFIISMFVATFRGGDASRSGRALRVVMLAFGTTSMFYNGLKIAVQPLLMLLALSAFSAPKKETKARVDS